MFVQQSGVVLCNWFALSGSLLIPVQGFCEILWDAQTDMVHACIVTLRGGHPLFGKFTISLESLFVILRYTFAKFVHASEIVNGDQIVALTCLAEPVKSLVVINGGSQAFSEHRAQRGLRQSVSLLGNWTKEP